MLALDKTVAYFNKLPHASVFIWYNYKIQTFVMLATYGRGMGGLCDELILSALYCVITTQTIRSCSCTIATPSAGST
jgi:hypothetical protein